MINLVKDTISNDEIDSLGSWLKTYPKLTKGSLTESFEEKWSDWLGVKHSVFVNSGSSANLAMFYALKVSGRLKNDKVIVPCVSWTTTLSPVIQLGLQPILCEASESDLGLNTDIFEELCKEHNPACVILVHVLGFPNHMEEILRICEKYDVILLEDSCESVGTVVQPGNKKTGSMGLMSSFSTYFGHHFSTIEGGLVSTNDFKLYEILKSIRSHGWSRDLSEETRKSLREEHNVDTFSELYTFYYPGFNIRSTDLQAFIGINQLDNLSSKNKRRYTNLLTYDRLIKNDYWKVKFDGFVSNFAYPVIHPNRDRIVKALNFNNIECRPLVCGNMAQQPYFKKLYGSHVFSFADKVHSEGLYVPNHPDLSEHDIEKICSIINQETT
tara:strand:- start:748 stop:1899 length:1152 start_codon:yes stop_codon:yes gene_type:complete